MIIHPALVGQSDTDSLGPTSYGEGIQRAPAAINGQDAMATRSVWAGTHPPLSDRASMVPPCAVRIESWGNSSCAEADAAMATKARERSMTGLWQVKIFLKVNIFGCSYRIRIRFCFVVLRRSAGNIGAQRLLTSTRGLLTSTGTGSCTCFSWVAARTHMYYSSAVRVAGPGDDSSRCLRVQAVHADLACRAAALGVEEVDRGLKCGL